MDIPSLKRIRISSPSDLTTWFAKNGGQTRSVMLVTRSRPSNRGYVSREQVRAALVAQGWTAGPRFTLNDTLIGHVISRPSGANAR